MYKEASKIFFENNINRLYGSFKRGDFVKNLEDFEVYKVVDTFVDFSVKVKNAENEYFIFKPNKLMLINKEDVYLLKKWYVKL